MSDLARDKRAVSVHTDSRTMLETQLLSVVYLHAPLSTENTNILQRLSTQHACDASLAFAQQSTLLN